MPSDRRNKVETKAAQDLKDDTRKTLNLFYEKVVIIDVKHKRVERHAGNSECAWKIVRRICQDDTKQPRITH